KLRENPKRLEILGNGRQAKSYFLVGECVEAMLHVIDQASDAYNLNNLGGDDALSVTRIAEMVVEGLGLSGVEFVYGGTEAGKPYLEHQLVELRRQGIIDVVLLTGHLGDQVEAYFGGGDRLGLSLRYRRELTPQGTGGGLRDAAELLADDFLLIYGDSYLPI